VSKYTTLDDDKKRNCDEHKSEEYRSKVTVVLSDDDDETDDFGSMADTCSSSRHFNVSASEEKKALFTECASVNGSDSDWDYKPSFITATSPPSVSSPPSTKSWSSPSLTKMSLNWAASNTQTTGIFCYQ